MTRSFGGSLVLFAALAFLWPISADAHLDLDLRAVNVHKINNCTNELKFKVRFRLTQELLHGHVGPGPAASYRVEVNVQTAAGGEFQIWEFPVMDQPLGSTIAFVVPDALRMCRDTLQRLQYYTTVVIRVDTQNEIAESNEANNIQVKHWHIQHPGPVSLGACYIAAGFNPGACR
ncbi:MAG TPA: hypothetical protein VJA45_09360 [Methylomirabilota bacterium]|jgi:hypothetical protein|nr:hypothetical protein [Methylomirabilota bacterium]